MASVQRVLVVDKSEQLSNIVRGALTLMDRHFILVQVPTAADALAELVNAQVDLLITTYTLSDSTGADLAARAIRESAGTPIMILADPNDPPIDAQTLENAPYMYLVRPVGEQFLRALRVGLDGEAIVEAQESNAGGSALELGPLPNIDIEALRPQVDTLIVDTGAMGVFVADRLGHIVYTDELTGKNYFFDVQTCVANLAPQFSRTVDLRDLLGGNAGALQHFDGDKYDVFALSLGLHYFIGLIFDGSKRPAFGGVTNFGRKIAESITDSIGPDAWSFRRSVQTTQTMPAVSASQDIVTSLDAEDANSTAISSEETQDTQPMLADELNLEPVEDLDVDKLFSQSIDEGDFENVFGSDDDDIFSSTGGSVSFDEAMNMGLLDE